jgi:AcrR family transcriptional regulator
MTELDDIGSPEGRRVIALLWDPATAPHGRGPKPKLALRQIVETGIAIADAQGLEQLSMRKVAAELEVGPMSLYTYVPGRSELVELMIDATYAGFGRTGPDGSWRERIARWVQGMWALYRRHPWLLEYGQARLPLGPHVLDVEEQLYAALAAAGYVGSDNVAAKNFVAWQVAGAGRAEISDEVETKRTGISYEEYWASRSSFWATHFDPGRYPTMMAIWQADGFDDREPYSLDRLSTRLLDALEVDRRNVP